MTGQYRVAFCKDAGREVVQIKENAVSWLCLHNNHIANENGSEEKLEILLDKVAVENFKLGARIFGR